MIVDSRATTGLPEATASLMSGLMRTRELSGRILGNSFAVAHGGRIIQNILDPVRRGGRGQEVSPRPVAACGEGEAKGR